MLEKGVHALAATRRPQLSRSAGVAQSARVCTGSLRFHRWLPETGNLWLGSANAAGASIHSGQHRRGLSTTRPSGQGPLHEFGGGIAGRVPLLSHTGPDLGYGDTSRMLSAYAAAILTPGS